MKILFLSTLLLSCAGARVVAYSSPSSTIKICSNTFSSFDQVEDEAQSICKDNYEILECGRIINGYFEGAPIRIPCCVVRCPNYKSRKRHGQ